MFRLRLALTVCLGAFLLPAADPAPRHVRAADGVPIVYEVRGRGETALVFVHCWACDRSYWRGQLDVFAHDYQVVSLDLAGHGQSGANRAPWSIAGLAGDVEAVVNHLRLRRVILIGHSMGGPVSLEAARRLAGRVVAVIGVDTLHNAEFQVPPGMLEAMVKRYTADFEGTMNDSVRRMFPPGADPEVLDWVSAKARRANPTVAIALLRDFVHVDLRKSFASVGVPIRTINAAPRPPQGMPTTIEANRKYADYDAVLMEGVGHFLMLERPAEFNQRLEKVLSKLGPGRPPR